MAIRLIQKTERDWVSIGHGARLLAEPANAMVVYAARAQAEEMLADLKASGEAVTRAGGRVEGLPDLTLPAELAAALQSLFVVALAEMVVTDWENVQDEDGSPLAFSTDLLVRLLAHPTAGEAFVTNYLHPLNQVVMAGNA